MGHLEPLQLSGAPDEIMAAIARLYPATPDVLAYVRPRIEKTNREVAPHEAAALAYLAHLCNGRHILEIGTALGYTAAIMATAAPGTKVITVNPKDKEYSYASRALAHWVNVAPLHLASWDLLPWDGPAFDIIFVDGDHGQAARDVAWWEYLTTGGLLLFHDYCPTGAGRPCQPVYEVVEAFKAALGRDPDVLVQTTDGVGMAGWIKRRGESTPSLDTAALSWHFDVGLHDWVRDNAN